MVEDNSKPLSKDYVAAQNSNVPLVITRLIQNSISEIYSY